MKNLLLHICPNNKHPTYTRTVATMHSRIVYKAKPASASITLGLQNKVHLKKVAGMKDISRMSKRSGWDTYHVVSRADVINGRASADECLAEIMMRFQYADKHYGGKIDRRHMEWMIKLWKRVDKIFLPLDTYKFIADKLSRYM
jgi:hypothetical protein